MRIDPYLFFNGRCDEAIAFYRGVFGVEPDMLMRFRDSPETPAFDMPEGWQDKVMHAAMPVGDTTLMMSDGCGTGPSSFDGFGLSVAMPDADAAKRTFEALADGGEVRMPLGETFFAPCFGMVADRFGVTWMLIVPA